ncbi:MAG: hypothetical protein OEZ06_27870 [Myxococcales bacterium]|nr:hypothetical protein [Myxococcales bacterium]
MGLAKLVDRVAALGGPSEPAAGRRLLELLLQALTAELHPPDRAPLRAGLPQQLHPGLEGGYGPALEPLDALLSRLSAELALEAGAALEQASIAGRAVGELLSADGRRQLIRRLPDGLGALLELPEPAANTGRRQVQRVTPRELPRPRLAAGRPGSEHPLSEAVADRTQSGAVGGPDVARTAHTLGGYSDERDRQGESLATGAPGSKRGLGDAER